MCVGQSAYCESIIYMSKEIRKKRILLVGKKKNGPISSAVLPYYHLPMFLRMFPCLNLVSARKLPDRDRKAVRIEIDVTSLIFFL